MHTLTLRIPDAVYDPLVTRANTLGRTPEEVLEDWVADAVLPPARDPLLQLLGTIKADKDDIALRHDEYIGQSLMPAEEHHG